MLRHIHRRFMCVSESTAIAAGLLLGLLFVSAGAAESPESPLEPCQASAEQTCSHATPDKFLIEDASATPPTVIGEEIDKTERLKLAHFWRDHVGGGFVGKLAGFQVNGHFFLDSITEISGDVFSSEIEFRRIRLSVSRNIKEHLGVKASIELLNGDIELKDLLVRRNYQWGDTQLGNFKEPFGLEQTASARETVFMERSLATVALAPTRSFGAGIRNSRNKFTLHAGVFVRSLEDDQLENEGNSFTARVTHLDRSDQENFRHLGLGLSYRNYSDSEPPTFATRPEVGLSDIYFADTGEIENAASIVTFGLEALRVKGPWSVQGEVIGNQITRDDGRGDLQFYGAYGLITWSPTNHARRYDSYNARAVAVRPSTFFDQGGRGAWQLAGRVSYINLNDKDVIGGAETNLTFGVVWTPGPYVRFMADLIKVVDVNRPGCDCDGADPLVLQARFQLAF